MSNLRKTLSGLLFIVVMLGLSVVMPNRAFAIDSKDVFTKVLVNNLETCYKNALVSSLPFTSYLNFDSLMNSGYKQSSDQNGFYIPAITDSYNKITQTTSEGGRVATCYALFMGDSTGLGTLSGSMTGLLEIYGKKSLVPTGITDRSAKLNNFMTNILKYSANTTQSSTTEYCYTVYAKENTTAAQPVKLGSACMNEDNYPLSAVNQLVFTGSNTTDYTLTSAMDYSESAPYYFLRLTVKSNDSSKMCIQWDDIASCSATAIIEASKPTTTSTVNFSATPGVTWIGGMPNIYVQIEKKTGTGEGSSNTTFNKDSNKWKDAVVAITGHSYDDFAFSDADKYDFYLQYLKQNYGKAGTEIGSTQCVASKPASVVDEANQKYYIWIKDSGWCLANLDSNKVNNKVKMTIFSDGANRRLNKVIDTLPELINAMANLDYSDASDFVEVGQQGQPDGETNPGSNGGNSGDPGGNSDEASCFTDGDSLGWILCPTIKMLGSAASAAYENIEHNWLQMDTSFFDTDKGTYDGWTQFRNYANILFSIAFVLIILAQVTGIGISNYNIKKLLPKFIMVVILVNLSFIICQIAVDISNILGSTLYDMFKGLNTGKTDAFGVDNLIVGLLTSVGTGALAGITVAGIAVAALTSPGSVLVPLVIAFIGALISLLFFFIVLAVRKAGIVILVVLSPVAIVCYALPNTKSLFDRWKKLFTSLLMVYPICAVLMGGGYFASNLLLKNNNNGFVETLVALLLQVVPIFLVPSVVRSSLALAGNIGTRLSMMGNNLGRRATGAIANAEMTKRAQTSMNYWGANTGQKALGKVGGAIGKIPGVGRAARAFGGTGIGKALKAGQTRRVAQNKMAYRKMRLDEGSNEYIAGTMTAQSIKNDLASQKYKQELERIDTTADSIITGNLSYTDGAGEHIVNANDAEKGGSLEQALEYYMNQYDAAIASGDEAAQEEMLTKARAVSKVMIEKGGDTGRSRVMHQLKRHAFDATGAVDKKASFRGLTKYLSQNDKWMGGLKAEDVGGHALVSEGANFTGSYDAPTHEGTFHSLMHYNTMGGGKVSTSAVPSLSDNFYDGYDDAAASGLYTVGSAAYNADVASGGHGARDLIQLSETLERAMADPTVAQKVKDKDLAKMEAIHKQAYDLQRDQWLAANRGKTRADYEAQFGAYQKLVKGKALKISHAKMPTGWKRADSMDVARFRSLGLSEGDWFNNSGLGSKLSAEQIKKAEAIEQQHIDADIQNGL